MEIDKMDNEGSKIMDFVMVGFAICMVSFMLGLYSGEASTIRNDKITECRPPNHQYEKLVARLDDVGGVLMLMCEYHQDKN